MAVNKIWRTRAGGEFVVGWKCRIFELILNSSIIRPFFLITLNNETKRLLMVFQFHLLFYRLVRYMKRFTAIIIVLLFMFQMFSGIHEISENVTTHDLEIN